MKNKFINYKTVVNYLVFLDFNRVVLKKHRQLILTDMGKLDYVHAIFLTHLKI